MKLTRPQAKAQFDYWTNKLGLIHTYSFDELFDYMEYKDRLKFFRRSIMALESKAKNHNSVMNKRSDVDKVNPLRHLFTDGLVVREITNPKGEMIVTRIHKREHPFFLMKGDMSIMTENGPVRIRAPHYGLTKAGTKRIIYTHEECVFITIHATNSKTVEELEEEFFTDDFEDVDKKYKQGGELCPQ